MHGFFPLHDGQRGLRTRLFLLLLEVNYIRCRLTVQNGKQHAMDEIMNTLFVKGFQKKKVIHFHNLGVFFNRHYRHQKTFLSRKTNAIPKLSDRVIVSV